MRIFLVKPHSYLSAKGVGAPLGLGYIASVLLEAGHYVCIEDLMLIETAKMEDVFKKKLKKVSPDVVGITCNSHERFFAFDIAKWTKEMGNIKVVMGGTHVTFTAEETLKNIPYVDVIVRHEGELTMKELCDKLENEKPINAVKGISYRGEKGEICTNPPRPLITDLDTIPFPARHLFDMEKYDLFLPIPAKPRVTNLITSRGCPFTCKFCSAAIMSGNRIRMRSPERSVDEMEYLLNEYPYLDGLFIYDDHFTTNKRRAISICEEIKRRGLRFRWGCYARVDSIDSEVMKTFKSVGCEMVSFGVESGSQKILKAMNKKTTPERIIKAIKTVKAQGIAARSSFLYRYPGEGFPDIWKTYILMHKAGLTPDEVIQAGYPIIYPATALFEELKESRYIPEDFNWEGRSNFGLPAYRDVPIYRPPYNTLRRVFYFAMNLLFRMR
ncbi:Anaerobic magnesium-protoporphyrin IX monomethyl ester cyclase [subsurface metagenome]